MSKSIRLIQATVATLLLAVSAAHAAPQQVQQLPRVVISGKATVQLPRVVVSGLSMQSQMQQQSLAAVSSDTKKTAARRI